MPRPTRRGKPSTRCIPGSSLKQRIAKLASRSGAFHRACRSWPDNRSRTRSLTAARPTMGHSESVGAPLGRRVPGEGRSRASEGPRSRSLPRRPLQIPARSQRPVASLRARALATTRRSVRRTEVGRANLEPSPARIGCSTPGTPASDVGIEDRSQGSITRPVSIDRGAFPDRLPPNLIAQLYEAGHELFPGNVLQQRGSAPGFRSKRGRSL